MVYTVLLFAVTVALALGGGFAVWRMVHVVPKP